MGVVKGAIGIKDNATAVLRGIRNEQSAFRRDVERTRRELQRTWDRRYNARVNATQAHQTMRRLSRSMQPLRQKIATVVAIKDIATAKMKAVANKVKALGKMIASPVVKLKNELASGISKAKGMLKSAFKAIAIPIAVAATVTSLVLGSAVKSGMQLEQQQVSMEHFISATNKDMSQSEVKKAAVQFSNELRDNANATPFETGEVMAAGSRAVAIASGNTKEAMGLIKLAEDMAAASGGTKSLSDAVEALADAKMGEMERLKEFGFKVSATEFQSKGFAGVSADLNDFFGGAAEKLATTGAGLLSTIKGKLKSYFADFGLQVVDKLKPVFAGVIALIDKSEPIVDKFSTGLADGIGKGINVAAAFMPKLVSGISAVKPMFMRLSQAVVPVIGSIMATIKTVMPAVLPVLQTVLTTVISVITAAVPIISGMVQGIGTVVSSLAPVFNTIFGAIGEKVGSVIGFVSERMGFIQEVIATASPVLAEILTTAWGVISPVIDICIGAFKLLFGVVQKVFPGIQKIITSVWNFIKPLVEGIGSVMKGIASGWNGLVDKVTGGGGDVGKNAKGTNNWKGGLTWVGEEGPELVDLPRSTRILPHKESVAYAKPNHGNGGYQVPQAARTPKTNSIVQQVKEAVHITVAKLADTIIVREEADIDKIGSAVADKIVKVVLNMP